MECLELIDIKKTGRQLEYVFSVSCGLDKYFSEKPFIIEYPDSIEEVPDAVLAIPFVASVLPLIWLTDSELRVPELDERFYDSISDFKKGYVDMYPEAEFKGIVTVGQIRNCTIHNEENKSAVLFSGGLDAVTTTLRHKEENPVLLSIWGSDIAYDNEKGWAVVENSIRNSGHELGLQCATIKSSFRDFDKENVCGKDFLHLLQRGWWYGAKHGIAIICHVAPYAYLHGLKTVYIASSNSVRDGVVRCASDPSIDNNVAFFGCRVVHDNFESSRQDKTEYLVKYRKDHNLDQIPLHVCWQSTGGTNCGHCEKCYRTMVGFWIAGDDPSHYGFTYDKKVFKDIYYQMALREEKYVAPKEWTYMKEALNQNWNALKGKPYRNKLKWMRDFNFFDPKSNKCRTRRASIQKLLIKAHLRGFVSKLKKLYR